MPKSKPRDRRHSWVIRGQGFAYNSPESLENIGKIRAEILFTDAATSSNPQPIHSRPEGGAAGPLVWAKP